MRWLIALFPFENIGDKNLLIACARFIQHYIMYKSTITKEEIMLLPKENFDGKITVVNTLDELNRALQKLKKHRIIGFDTETKPSFTSKEANRNSTALMQLSTQRECFLLRLNKIGFPENLTEFISNPTVKKIGISLKDDFHVLRKNHELKPNAFVDLQSIIADYGIEEKSLQKIYAILFEKRISKSQRLSNWEAENLTEAQQEYAAIDAWACLQIYNKLIGRGVLHTPNK